MRVPVRGANHKPFARSILRADVFAGLLQFESDQWRRHSTGPRSVRPRNSVPLPHGRAIAMALFPLRYPINEANGCFGGIAMHMCTWFWHQMPFENPRAHTICLIRGGLERVPPPSCAGPRTRHRTTPTAA
jgi:hypothetical protein